MIFAKIFLLKLKNKKILYLLYNNFVFVQSSLSLVWYPS
jgi:hypothetical protein